ncbi:uncharacterized protein LOC129581850 [Paramacrobiotus metropolitanus]|uniref:uncharacterized protein LOC129581850 n=1 Tax=Paramacrobiotus metropolitanus TaxID=2943436 RepID=UPI0024464CB9|nr:uncharacterized protein LOC129581850 [Paramacrobiotus metropolitanus]
MDSKLIFACICALAIPALCADRGSHSNRGRARTEEDQGDSRLTGNYVRIKVEILKLTNDQGLASSGSHCDFAGTCDPVLYCNLDTERPNADWPGSKPDNTWPTVFGVDNVNSPNIGTTIHKDICGPKYNEANLRIFALDRDPASKDDLINQWDCPINRNPDRHEGSAEWSPTFECLPKYQPGKMKLTYRYQVFHITRSQCNSTVPNAK